MAMRQCAPAARQLQHTCQSLRTICSSTVSAGGWFGNVEQAPKDPILGVTEAYLADENPDKINLGVVSLCPCTCGLLRGFESAPGLTQPATSGCLP